MFDTTHTSWFVLSENVYKREKLVKLCPWLCGQREADTGNIHIDRYHRLAWLYGYFGIKFALQTVTNVLGQIAITSINFMSALQKHWIDVYFFFPDNPTMLLKYQSKSDEPNRLVSLKSNNNLNLQFVVWKVVFKYLQKILIFTYWNIFHSLLGKSNLWGYINLLLHVYHKQIKPSTLW